LDKDNKGFYFKSRIPLDLDAIVMIIKFKMTNFGYIQIYCYVSEKDFSKYEKIYLQVFDNIVY